MTVARAELGRLHDRYIGALAAKASLGVISTVSSKPAPVLG
jgi:hypothetical protein